MNPPFFVFIMAVFVLSSCNVGVSTPTIQATQTPEVINTISPTETPEKLRIGSTMVSPKDGMTMVYIPAGEFMMGSDPGSGYEQPVHKVYLDAFWIDRTEITNAMFAKFSNETGYVTDAEKYGGSYVYRNESWKYVNGTDWMHPLGPDSNIVESSDHPVIHITWESAKAYCSWANRKLPTEAEWEKAASWDEKKNQKYVYPWGNDFNGGLLNFCDKNCPFSWADMKSDDGFEYTAPVGSYPNGASLYGVYDMAGNAFEWVADWYSETYYSTSPASNPLGPVSGEYRVLRGGSWNYSREDHFQSASRFGLVPLASELSLGFRCAMSASE